MSIIAAGTSSGTALVSTGDTNGTLVIQTNGTTVAATFGTDQKLTLAGALVTTGVSTFAAGSAAAPSLTTTGDTNTGIFFPAADTIGFSEGGAEAMRIDSTGNVLIGTTTGTNPRPLTVQTPAGNYVSKFMASASNFALMEFANNANNNTDAIIGTVEANTLAFYTNGFTERMRIDTSGNVLVTSAAGLGYGTGSGGTVTQATNKGTAVTLNKPTGQITTNNAALGSGATVSFSINNSIISATDVVVVVVSAGSSYTVQPAFVQGGVFNIRLTNTTGGSLSEAVTINFAIIKGASA